MNFHATPYDISATGFHFEDEDQFADKAKAHRNEYGQPVEEYEIQFIDGSDNEAELVKAIGINQANIGAVIEFVDGVEHDDELTAAVLYLLNDRGETFDQVRDQDEDEIRSVLIHTCGDDVYSEEGATEDYAYEYADQIGLFEDSNETLKTYFDFKAYGRDMRLNGDIAVTEHGGKFYIMDAHA